MVLAILQARMSSSRLPGKVLRNILDKPMLLHQVERIKRSKLIDKILIATSIDPSDDSIKLFCEKNELSYFRGSLDDVLDRFYKAAGLFNADHIVRLTGDCPLVDPEVIDELIKFYLSKNYDYVSNTIRPTFPDGLDVEVFNFLCLKKTWYKAKLISEREHVTPFIKKNKELFRIFNFVNEKDLSSLRWTVDEYRDFEFVTKIYERLYFDNNNFLLKDILELLDREPILKEINSCINRDEGYIKSLKEDRIFYKR